MTVQAAPSSARLSPSEPLARQPSASEHKRPSSIRIPSFSSATSSGEPTPSPKVPGRWQDPPPAVARSSSLRVGGGAAAGRGRRIASFIIPNSGGTPSPTNAEFAAGLEWERRPREKPAKPSKEGLAKRRTINFGRTNRPNSTFDQPITSAAASQPDPQQMDSLLDKILYQSGADSGGPILVLAPVHLPSNSTLPHSTVLPKLRERLEGHDNEYSVVLFTQPTPHPPPTSLLVSTYLALPRQTRKNVKRVYVVGGGWWVKLVTTVFTTTLLSGKTAKRKKLVQCATLSKLAEEMGTDSFVQLEIPAEAYAANSSHEQTITLPQGWPVPRKMFGVPLEELMGPSGQNGLPRVVRDALAVIRKEAPTSVGIFRRSPSAVTVQVVREAYDRGHPVTIETYPDDAFLAASLLKLYLRELPAPLIPASLFSTVREIPLGGGVDAQDFIAQQVLPALDRNGRLLFTALASVLSETAKHAEVNLMPVPNLLVCLSPCLVGGVSIDSLNMTRAPSKADKDNTVGGMLQVCIQHYDRIFGPDPAAAGEVNPAKNDLLGLKPISSSPLFPTAPPTPPLSVESSPMTVSNSTTTLHITAEDTEPASAEVIQDEAAPVQVTVESPHMGDLGAEWVQAEGAFADGRRMSRAIDSVLIAAEGH